MFYDLEGNLINTVAPTSGVVLGICCDEDYFYVIEGSQTIAKYDNSGTIVSSFVLAGAHTNQSICTDGTNIYIGRKHAGAAPSFVACYSTNFSGSLVWIANDDENQKDLPSVSCLKNEDFVYVGVSGNANRNIFKIRKSDGVEVGEYQGTTDIDCLAVGESFILFSNSSGVEWVDKNFEFPSAFIHQSIVSTLRANAISYCGNDLFALAMKKDSTNDGVFCLYDERLKNQVYGLGNDSGQQTARAVASNGYLVCYAGQALIGLPGVLEHGIRVEPCRASGVLQKASVGERELASSVLK